MFKHLIYTYPVNKLVELDTKGSFFNSPSYIANSVFSVTKVVKMKKSNKTNEAIWRFILQNVMGFEKETLPKIAEGTSVKASSKRPFKVLKYKPDSFIFGMRINEKTKERVYDAVKLTFKKNKILVGVTRVYTVSDETRIANYKVRLAVKLQMLSLKDGLKELEKKWQM